GRKPENHEEVHVNMPHRKVVKTRDQSRTSGVKRQPRHAPHQPNSQQSKMGNTVGIKTEKNKDHTRDSGSVSQPCGVTQKP
ncbi:Uncharacterized protein DAT39_019188, partial [Clarias magur]